MGSTTEQIQAELRRQDNDNPLITEENVFSVIEDAMDGECPRDAHGCRVRERRRLAMLLWQREKTKQEKHMQTGLIRKVPQMVISTLLGLLLGVAAYADTATAVAEPVTTQSATASAPAHAVTLYGLTLGEVVPQLPECHPDVAFGRIGDDICITYAEGFYSTVDPHLKYGTADEVVIWFPDAMQSNRYPQAVVIGTDKDDRMVYFSFYTQNPYDQTTGLPPEMTQGDQEKYIAMVTKQLGAADILIIRTRSEDRSIEAMMRDRAPEGVPSAMWDVAADQAMIAVWLKKDVWAKYVGRHDEVNNGFLEIGLRSMFADGQVPNK
ncbi:hypothetical protein [Saezia sanguinis]|uniref:hypothetical protein n=1 Tax=Saezia sanguinis TaxID=1965230 RepID=UPI003036BEF5